MQLLKKSLATVAFIAAVAMLSTATVWADNAIVDGDGLTPVSTNALAFGSVCANSTTTKDVLFAVQRQSQGATVFKDGSTASVTVGTVTGTGLSAVVEGTSTIAIPSGWSGAGNGTPSPAVTSRVTFAAGAAGTTLSGSVAYTASGVNQGGNSFSRSTTLTVTATVVSCDTTPPTLNLPASMTVEATSSSGAIATYSASATDTDPLHPAVSCSPASGSTFALGTTTVNCSATDTAGNTATGSFTVTVQDTTGPVIAGMPSNVTLEAVNDTGATVTYGSPTAIDAVDGARNVSCIPPSGSVLPLGANTVTCSASDAHGNSSSSSFVVTVADSTAPALTLPGALTAEATSPDGAAVSFSASAIDAVDGTVTPTCAPASGSTFHLGSTTVGCTAVDSHGNSNSGSFDVSVVDTTAPTLGVPASFSVEATGPAGAVATYSASATDLVDGDVTPVCAPASGATFALGSTTVTCTATDAAGNIGTASFTVTVIDTTPPVLSLPADVIVEADGPAGHVVTFAISANDLVDGSRAVTCSSPSGAAFAVGTTTVTCSALDATGNTAQGSFMITVTDTTAPLVTAPADITTEATGPGGAAVIFDATADDIVDGTFAATCVPASGSTFALGTTTVTCSATDTAGNTGSDTFTVTVTDTTPPEITGTPTNLEVEATSSTGAIVTYTAPTASDLVDGPVDVSCIPASGSTFPLDETTTVTCTAADAAGNPSTSTFTVRVSDRSEPSLLLPDNMTAEATGPDGATVTFTPSATDTVDGSVAVTCEPPSGSTFALGDTSVGCSATDAHDNTASGSFLVTVVDTTRPVLTLPDDITTEATSPAGASVSYTASALDLVDGAVAVTCAPVSGSTFPVGDATVNCSTTDSYGNTATGSFTVEVVDTTAPALSLPGAITAEATGPGGAAVLYSATASDIVDGSLTPACSPAPGGFPLGTTTVTCTATDAHGNSASGSFTVAVVDTTTPALTLSPNLVAEATGPAGAAVNYEVTASDIVDGSVTPSCSPASGSTFGLGTTAVNCSATDAHGNTSTGSFTVTVQDTTAPVISGTPSNVVQEATGASGAVVTYTPPSATDLVDGAVAVTCSPGSGSVFALDAITTVTCSAGDAAGNPATSEFTVHVQDTTGPALSLPGAIVAEATGPSGAEVPFAPSASDLVDGSLPVNCTPASGSLFGFGTTTVGCSASDVHGNGSNGTFDVTVRDTTAPVLTLPADITVEATGPAGAAVTYTASASDVVDGALTPTCTVASGSTFALGTTTVTCTVTDTHGNSSTSSFTVTVHDTTEPALTLPAPIEVTATSASGADVAYAASATDIVDGTVTVVCSPVSGSTFAAGAHTVNCTATDSHANTANGQFTVTVKFDLGGLLAPVKSGVLNTVKGGSTVPLKWQIRTPSGGYITSTSIVSGFALTQVNCGTLTALSDEVDFTTTGATSLRYDFDANQFVQNWQTPKKAGNCYRVDVMFVGGLQKLTATFQMK